MADRTTNHMAIITFVHNDSRLKLEYLGGTHAANTLIAKLYPGAYNKLGDYKILAQHEYEGDYIVTDMSTNKIINRSIVRVE